MRMTVAALFSRLYMPAAALALAVAVAGAAQSAATHADPRAGGEAPPSDVAKLFADAPDGVDPIVTGPVSAAFSRKQATAGCDTAVWPNIPAVCYPD